MTEILAAPSFVCHKTLGRSQRKLQCAGHMILRGKKNAFVAAAAALSEKITLTGRHLVFESEDAAIKHHTTHMEESPRRLPDLITRNLPDNQTVRQQLDTVVNELRDIKERMKIMEDRHNSRVTRPADLFDTIMKRLGDSRLADFGDGRGGSLIAAFKAREVEDVLREVLQSEY